VERAGDRGVDLIAMGRDTADIRDEAALKAAIAAVDPELVINASAYTAVDKAEDDEADAFAVNAAGPETLARLCAARDIPLIHLSTDYVFDGTLDRPYSERDQVGPIGAYGRSKLAGELGATAANDKCLILRTAWVYSPFGNNFLKTMLRLAADRDEVSVVADQHGTPTGALDIADAILSMSESLLRAPTPDKFGVFNLVAAGEATWADFAEHIFEVSRKAGGPYARVRRIPTADFPTRAKRPANSRLDTSRLAQIYGLTLPDWRASTEDCVRRLISKRVLS